jgi:hypothetical protein
LELGSVTNILQSMKRYIIQTSVVFFLLLASVGCVTLRPDSRSISEPDYNQRVIVSDPHFDKVLSPVGYGSFVAATLAGGYAGYQSDIIKYNSGTEQKNFRAGNAVLGAALGFSASYFINRALGWGQTIQNVDGNKWIRKANNQYKLVTNQLGANSGGTSGLKVISRAVESQFSIRNLYDAREFVSTFPSSQYSDITFKTGIENCRRNELPDLITIFPLSKYVPDAKITYIRTSPGYSDICNGVEKYSALDYDFEPDFLKLIRNTDNGIDFIKRYRQSGKLKEAYLNSFSEMEQPLEKYSVLDKSYQEIVPAISRDDIKNQDNNIKRNYFDRYFRFENIKDPFEVDTFYSQYKWLEYADKSKDLIRNYFNVSDQYTQVGDYILWMLRNLPDKDKHPHLQPVKKSEVEDFISRKLSEEFEKKVKISSRDYTSNSNKQWEDWKSNDTYTAGLVAEKGALFLLYGKIENKSKFSLPVKVSANADLFYTGEMQGTGPFTNGAIGLLKLFSGVNSVTWQAGSQSGEYFIPQLPPSSTASYSILMNFESNIKKLGVNFFDLIKYKQEADLRNVNVNVEQLTFEPSPEALKLQMATQLMVKNGLPDAPAIDLLRGKEVKNDEWNEKWQEILETRARIAREMEQRRQAAIASGRCVQFEESVKITYDRVEYAANQYRDLINDQSFIVFYFPGDEDDDPGFYKFEWRAIGDSDLSYKSKTEADLLNKITPCNKRY